MIEILFLYEWPLFFSLFFFIIINFKCENEKDIYHIQLFSEINRFLEAI